jgi:hypothetical protein
MSQQGQSVSGQEREREKEENAAHEGGGIERKRTSQMTPPGSSTRS